eukprot:3248931-Prymnesium_polylepis.1
MRYVAYHGFTSITLVHSVQRLIRGRFALIRVCHTQAFTSFAPVSPDIAAIRAVLRIAHLQSVGVAPLVSTVAKCGSRPCPDLGPDLGRAGWRNAQRAQHTRAQSG